MGAWAGSKEEWSEPMISKETFLRQYNLEEEDLRAADLTWEELEAVYEDYLKKE